MKNYQFKTVTSSSFIAIVLSLLGMPALAFNLTINPPPSLTIDGMDISEGVFTLESAIGYSPTLNGDSLINSPVSIMAMINGNGEPTNLLIADVPDDIEVLQLTGNFNAGNPDKPPALFDITLFGFNDGIDDFTYFLPTMTGQPQVFQVTDLGSTTALNDNINTFSSAAPTITADSNGVFTVASNSTIGTSNGNNCPPPVVNVNAHGGGGGIAPQPCVVPEPGSALSLLALASLGTISMVKRGKKSV